ncbi:MAG: alpha/beta hydrolase [Chloroflexota bacterium]|nr:alpha/beta hydrolase [Chloroflexota bacterium]
MPTARVNGVTLHYEDVGEGPAIILLHGYTGSHQDWAAQIPVLSGRYRVIAVDQRGHAQSEAPSSAADYSVKIMAEDAHALLKHLGIGKSAIMGHSMGGFMALELVLKYPDVVTALVLVDTSSGEFERVPDFAEIRARLDELARTEGLNAAFEYNAEHNPAVKEQYERHPERREISRQKVLQTSVDGYIYVSRSFGEWEPLTPRLSEIRVPTLIVVGDEDIAFHRASKVMKESIAGAELVTLAGSGHSPHEEVPDAFNNVVLGFLDGLKLSE